MAPNARPTSTSPNKDPLSLTATDKLRRARVQKAYFELDIREAYFFALPQALRSISSQSMPILNARPQDAAELQTTIGMEESENFVTTLINSFMPPGKPWVSLKPASAVPKDLKKKTNETAKEVRKVVFDLIEESNLYAEAAKTMNPDAAAGTYALMITSRGPLHEPVKVLGVPLRELEIDIGPDGNVDTRFVVKHCRYQDLDALIPSVKLPEDIEKRIQKTPKANCELRWGWWRIWKEEAETWQHVIMLGDQVIDQAVCRGTGSVELHVARFNPRPEHSFGNGPLIRALPDLRILDTMSAAEVENADMALRPPMGYPDDSFANIEQGVESGGWYAVRPGSEGAIKALITPQKLDAAMFTQAGRERRVKHLFYNDFPEQRGDTPPTATQWVDEMAVAQRKIGTPGLAYWREGPKAIFERFFWIAKERGLLKDLLSKEGKEITLTPYNPTQQAQNQQKVATAARAAQIGSAMFPEEWKASVDGAVAIQKINELMDVQDVFPARDPEQVKAAVAQIAQLQGGGQPGQLQPAQPGEPGAMPPPALAPAKTSFRQQ